MTKKQCPLGEDCDLELVCSCSLTAAWMACAVKSAAKAQDQIKAQAAEIERLRAKLAKAVGVIDWALIAWDDHNKHGYNMQGDWVSDARTTLAALTGGNP